MDGETLGIAWNIASMVVGAVVTIIFGYIIYRMQRSEQKPSWDIRTNTWVKDHISSKEGLKIEYMEQPVTTLSFSKVIFWNAGKEVIHRDDIPDGACIEIKPVGEVEILYADLLGEPNDKLSQFECKWEPSSKTAQLEFNFLGTQKGGVIEVAHTGTTSEDIKVVGRLENVDLKREQLQPRQRSVSILSDFMYFVLVFVAVAVAVAIVRDVFSVVGFLLVFSIGGVVGIVGIVGGGFLASVLLGDSDVSDVWKRLRSSKIPKGLEIFDPT